MTPKEKADKLCIDFLMKPNNTDIRFGMDKQLAKQCALIAVDEIIDASPTNPLKSSYIELYSDMVDECIEYWQEVKTEIEKL
jgi:hypothetical protein